MKRNLTCIICPRGCSLEVEILENGVTVKGNACPKGEQYGIDECTHPTRTVTSIVRVANRQDTMVSVKTENPIPKEKIFDLMKEISAKEVNAPIEIGDVICNNLCSKNIIAYYIANFNRCIDFFCRNFFH